MYKPKNKAHTKILLEIFGEKIYTEEFEQKCSKVIEHMQDLYINNIYKYLKMNKDGRYNTVEKKYGDKNFMISKLNEKILKQHLMLELSIGSFSIPPKVSKNEKYTTTKFMSFDVDYRDLEKAKWVTSKIINSLMELGVGSEYINVVWSGSKGYHIDICFDKHITETLESYLPVWKAKEFFDAVIEHSDVRYIKGGMIEFRPFHHKKTSMNNEIKEIDVEMGIRLPFSVNFKSKLYGNEVSWFVDWENGFKILEGDWDYIFSIKKLDPMRIVEIVRKYKDRLEDTEAKEEIIQNVIDIDTQEYKTLDEIENAIIEQNVPMNEYAEYLLKYGIEDYGKRHFNTITLAIYFYTLGYAQEDIYEKLMDWMSWQTKYKSSMYTVERDIESIIEYVIRKDLHMRIMIRSITITKAEMLKILELKTVCEKKTAYELLKKAKRHCIPAGTEFYYTMEMIALNTEQSQRNVQNVINKLVKNGFIASVRRNGKMIEGDWYYCHKDKKMKYKDPKKEVNLYKFEWDLSKENEGEQYNANVNFIECIISMFKDKEIRKLFSRTQGDNIIRYKYNNTLSIDRRKDNSKNMEKDTNKNRCNKNINSSTSINEQICINY